MFTSWQGFVSELRHRMATDNDNVVVIDGYEGTGKSNLGILLAKTLNPSFDPARDCVFNHGDWQRIFNANLSRQVYLIDEGGNLLFSRDYASSDSKTFVKLLMQARILQSTIIIAMPNINWLEKYVREHRIRYRIHMFRRGAAIFQLTKTDWRSGGVRMVDCFKASQIGSVRSLDPALWARYQERKVSAIRLQAALAGAATPPIDEETRLKLVEKRRAAAAARLASEAHAT